jgi:hypothetical protein
MIYEFDPPYTIPEGTHERLQARVNELFEHDLDLWEEYKSMTFPKDKQVDSSGEPAVSEEPAAAQKHV